MKLTHLIPIFAAASFAAFSQASPESDDFGDHPGFAHAMDVRTEIIDGIPVVHHYGQVRPEFATGTKSSTRQRAVMKDAWQFRFDPGNEGIAAGWAKGPVLEKDWTAVTVPHCWDMMPGGRFHDWTDTSPANPPHYNGTAWYRREFNHQMVPGKHHRFEFLGVQQRARIYLNGHEIALHEGGGQAFSIDVTAHLKAGKNLLALKVIRRANHQALQKDQHKEPQEIEQIHGPHPKAPDNWPYAGITREVALIQENSVTVRKTLLKTSNGSLEAAVILANASTQSGTFSACLESPALDGEVERIAVEVPAGGVRVVKFHSRLRDDAIRWSPEKPALHAVKVSIFSGASLVDEWSGRFGIREIAVEGARILLNGQAIFLKGVAMYEETHERGAALRAADHQRLFRLCKDSGANFIRLQVTQRSPLVYQLADHQGFMLTGEWGGFWYREAAMAAQTNDPRSIYQSHARCAVWDLMNHPSVILWCTHNESHQFCGEYGNFVAKATQIIRELDWQNRPVSWAAWHPHMGQPEFQHSDVVGFNEYRGAMDPFENLEPDMKRITQENPDKPLLIMENGAWSKPGKRGKPEERGTEDWQAELLRRQHAVLTSHIPPLAGYTYWLLADYRSRKFYTANPESDGYSAMGLYGPKDEVKLVRDVFRDLQWPIPSQKNPSSSGQTPN
jgi:beta-glucuronidase